MGAPAGLALPDPGLFLPERFQIRDVFGTTSSTIVHDQFFTAYEANRHADDHVVNDDR